MPLLFALRGSEGNAASVQAIEAMLEGPQGQKLRNELASWVLQFLPVESLVPDAYAQWRPLVHDAMRFVFCHLSSPRLAPKLIEQVGLPLDTNPEVRLLKLIAKVPGLQKLGQVLARNQNLPRALRTALSELENGISDVGADEIRSIIVSQLDSRLDLYSVKIQPTIFSEASVSAVVRFVWRNPEGGLRERGVFKVLKPYIRECFAEDMSLLAHLAKDLGSRYRDYGFAPHVLPDTFNDVRRLLQHEVDFKREQATLQKAAQLYAGVRGVRIPRLIQPLCSERITAITEERGRKITEVTAHMPISSRAQVCAQLIDALIAIPLFAPTGDVMFHADPHAGNLLYDKRSGELVILDWALTEHLTRPQRRHLAMLFLMIVLRDASGAREAIQALSPRAGRRARSKARIIRDCVTNLMDQLPVKHVAGAVDTMDLLEQVAWEGVRLPASLVMFRKALFTLDGILHDIGAPDFSMESVLARHLVQNWIRSWRAIGSPLSLGDWLQVQCSALLFPGRLWVKGAETMLEAKPHEVPGVTEVKTASEKSRQAREQGGNGTKAPRARSEGSRPHAKSPRHYRRRDRALARRSATIR
jgi:ubiquinone biosynthesis protein